MEKQKIDFDVAHELDDKPVTNGIVKHENNAMPLMPVDMSHGDLPDLDDAEEIPFDLMGDYWSPSLAGEEKRLFFDSIKSRQVQDNQNPEVTLDLPCAYFFEKVNGEIKTITNGSKRLVAAIENNHIQRGTPLVVTYLGKKRNTTNSFMSDNWSVRPLVLKLKNNG